MAELFRSAKVAVRPVMSVTSGEQLEAVMQSQAELSAWESWAVGEYTMEKARQYLVECRRMWDESASFTFALLDPIDGKLIGTSTIRVANRDNNFANLGYWVHSRHTGQGIATTAASAIAKHGFNQLGFNRIEIVAQVANIASRRVAEKLGAKFEGIMRNRLAYTGAARDAAMYSLIPGDIES